LKMEDEKGPLCGETTLLFMDMTMMLCNGSVLPHPLYLPARRASSRD